MKQESPFSVTQEQGNKMPADPVNPPLAAAEKTEELEYSQKNPQPPPPPPQPKAPSEDRSGERAGCSARERPVPDGSDAAPTEGCGRERLKRHRVEMAGRVWVPEMWGQERMLKEWVDCSAFDSSLFPKGLASARESLVEECRRSNSGGLRVEKISS